MGKKQERGREPESWAENGIERKRRDQKVKRSRSQTEQGAQLSDVREGEGGGRATGRQTELGDWMKKGEKQGSREESE